MLVIKMYFLKYYLKMLFTSLLPAHLSGCDVCVRVRACVNVCTIYINKVCTLTVLACLHIIPAVARIFQSWQALIKPFRFVCLSGVIDKQSPPQPG